MIVLDLDQDLVLANADLHIPKRSWKRGLQHAFDWSVPAHDLAYTRATLDQPNIDMPVRCTADMDRQIVHIEIGAASHDRAIALSGRCLALLKGMNSWDSSQGISADIDVSFFVEQSLTQLCSNYWVIV